MKQEEFKHSLEARAGSIWRAFETMVDGLPILEEQKSQLVNSAEFAIECHVACEKANSPTFKEKMIQAVVTLVIGLGFVTLSAFIFNYFKS